MKLSNLLKFLRVFKIFTIRDECLNPFHHKNRGTGFDWVIISVQMTNSMQLPLCQVRAVAQKGT
ncbi:hypothetical protein BpHYR1_018875 [Brachionus plicatilis]|uniref:Uncharacterized protein n=1 Tax=Brachionus plicatilis TaxID=10195 RepID=A0A3M7PWY4_BRAPC|nr:hypothetical protein BpHYR1_018875 [Brachionus plicatilis]